MPTSVAKKPNRTKLDKEVNALIKRIKGKHTERYGNAEITFAELLSDSLLLSFVIREGLPYAIFDSIQRLSPFSEKDWSNILDLSTKSLQRYKESSTDLRPIHAEKILEMAEVTQLGLEVFGGMEKFSLWLHTPSFALGSVAPIELLGNSYGKEIVVGELTRINYGILS
jgi:putative toxin-antitoxin system antitoxin component (TIGR02293 family)